MVMMMMQSGFVNTLAVRCSCRPNCLASDPNSVGLRSQLDLLHAEAETARAKVNSARSRLLRLTEAAEKLRRQAAVNVQRGKDDEARELLFQKKKVMQALENSRSRIELLDKLSTRLHQEISLKESQLIERIASDAENGVEDDSSTVHIVYPKDQAIEDEYKNEGPCLIDSIKNKTQEFNLHGDLGRIQPSGRKVQKEKASGQEGSFIASLPSMNSYEGFLEHLDQQLSGIEEEVFSVLNVSTFFIDNEEKQRNFRMQQIMELLEIILALRQRITNILQSTVDIS